MRPGEPVTVVFPTFMSTKQRAWLRSTTTPLRSVTFCKGETYSHIVMEPVRAVHASRAVRHPSWILIRSKAMVLKGVRRWYTACSPSAYWLHSRRIFTPSLPPVPQGKFHACKSLCGL